MNKDQLNKLLEYIDMRIRLENAHDSSDGGLIESIHLSEIKKELKQICDK